MNLPLAIPDAGPTIVNSLSIEGPPGFRWLYGDGPTPAGKNPEAGPRVVASGRTPAPGETTQTVDVFINPVVQNVDRLTGRATTTTLPDGSPLAISMTYTTPGGARLADSPRSNPALGFVATGLNQSLAAAPPPLPALGMGTYAATFAGQSAADGLGHILLSNLPADSTLVEATLGDVAGIQLKLGSSFGRPELGLGATPVAGSRGTSIDLTFPPVRDEAGTTMTLRFRLASDPTLYVSDVVVPPSMHTDPGLRDPSQRPGPGSPSLVLSPAGTPGFVSYRDPDDVLHTVRLQSLLGTPGSLPRYSTIVLSDGTYDLDQPLTIHTGLVLRGAGNDATLRFTFASTTGTDLAGAINIRSNHVTLENFKVRFLLSTVDFAPTQNWAVIDSQDVSHQRSIVDLNIRGLDIRGVFSTSLVGENNSRVTMPSIAMGNFNSGTIEGNTIFGGVVGVQWGPWRIANNTYLGAVIGTASPAAFAFDTCHDIELVNNTIRNQSALAGGFTDRFFTANHSGYGFTVAGNVISNGIGLIAPNPGGVGAANPRNSPEVAMFEDYGVIFEGTTSAVALSDGAGPYGRRLIAVATDTLLGGYPAVGELKAGRLFILDGAHGGTSLGVIQSFPSGDGLTTYFLLSTALPEGSFSFSIAPSYDSVTIRDNSFDLRGTTSTALALSSSMSRVQVRGNLFRGDASVAVTGNGSYYNQAIRIQVSAAMSGPLIPHRIEHVYATFNPMTEVEIRDNTIIDAIGGVSYTTSVGTLVPTSYGRTYGYVNLSNNSFQYSYQNSRIIAVGISVERDGRSIYAYSGVVGGTSVYDPAADFFADALALSLTASGNALEWTGNVTPPSAHAEVMGGKINGVLYGFHQAPNPSILTHLPPPSANSLNQDNADVVGMGPSPGPDGYQDVHVVLSGLPTNLGVTQVIIQQYGGGWSYRYASAGGAVPGYWAAALRRGSAGGGEHAGTADLYFAADSAKAGYQGNDGHSPNGPAGHGWMSNHYDVLITYSDGTTASVAVFGVVADPALRVESARAATRNQDNRDRVGATAGPDGYQDVHIALSGLRSDLEVATIEVQPQGYGRYTYVAPGYADPHPGEWRAVLDRASAGAGAYATTGELYVKADRWEGGYGAFEIRVTYADGTVEHTAAWGVVADPSSATMFDGSREEGLAAVQSKAAIDTPSQQPQTPTQTPASDKPVPSSTTEPHPIARAAAAATPVQPPATVTVRSRLVPTLNLKKARKGWLGRRYLEQLAFGSAMRKPLAHAKQLGGLQPRRAVQPDRR